MERDVDDYLILFRARLNAMTPEDREAKLAQAKAKWDKNWELIREVVPEDMEMAGYIRDTALRVYLNSRDPKFLEVAEYFQDKINQHGKN